MIGVLDLAQQGLVMAALERCGHPTATLGTPEYALREIVDGHITALVIESITVETEARDLLAAARSRSLPVLMVARDRSVSAAVETLRAGATDYIAAPFEYETLISAVDRLLDASSVKLGGPVDNGLFITEDDDTRATLALARSIAASDATVLIEGESGTGKELLAQLVHRASPRRNRELISINCAALPPGLMESEMFGHERGAFTGAFSRVQGKFELAHGSTILLDEIGELELSLQAKLLRVLQEKQVQRIGARRPINVDFRLVATTNRHLMNEVNSGRFREDLFYRLNVLPMRLNPLRERRGDVRTLVEHFLNRDLDSNRLPPLVSDEAMQTLTDYDWPGNARELENLMARIAITMSGRVVMPEHLGLTTTSLSISNSQTAALPPVGTIKDMERWLIVEVLKRREGNRTQAARELGISLRTLRNKIHDYEINDPETLPRLGGPRAHVERGSSRQTSPTR